MPGKRSRDSNLRSKFKSKTKTPNQSHKTAQKGPKPRKMYRTLNSVTMPSNKLNPDNNPANKPDSDTFVNRYLFKEHMDMKPAPRTSKSALQEKVSKIARKTENVSNINIHNINFNSFQNSNFMGPGKRGKGPNSRPKF